jgi:hypothetical protein
VLDDIVSELWRKENVTSGYCPRYRYTLIATLTLGNSYYICVDFLPTHTIGESVLPAHFLRAFFVGRSGVCRSFHVDHSLDHVDRSFGRPRSCGNHSCGSFVGSYFARSSCASHSLGHSLFHVGPRFVRE